MSNHVKLHTTWLSAQTTFAPDYVGNPKLWPAAIIEHIVSFSKKEAIQQCNKFNNDAKIAENIAALQDDGTIPKHLQYRYKKILNGEDEIEIKKTLFHNTINKEIAHLQERNAIINNDANNRPARLLQDIQTMITIAKVVLNTTHVTSFTDYAIQHFLTTFISKQQKDKAIKEKKALDFQTRKEKEEEVMQITKKGASKVNAEIKALTRKVKQLEAKTQTNRSGKGKGQQKKAAPAVHNKNKKKSGTKDLKSKGGNKKGSVNTRK